MLIIQRNVCVCLGFISGQVDSSMKNEDCQYEIYSIFLSDEQIHLSQNNPSTQIKQNKKILIVNCERHFDECTIKIVTIVFVHEIQIAGIPLEC